MLRKLLKTYIPTFFFKNLLLDSEGKWDQLCLYVYLCIHTAELYSNSC